MAGAGGTWSRGPACGDATVQAAISVDTGLTRVFAVRSPEGPLFRATTRTARPSNNAWRRTEQFSAANFRLRTLGLEIERAQIAFELDQALLERFAHALHDTAWILIGDEYRM